MSELRTSTEYFFEQEDSYTNIQPLDHDGLYATAWTATHKNEPVIVKRYHADPENLGGI